MRSARGMGAVAPAKQPKPRRAQRKDGAMFDVYAKGGLVVKRKKQEKK